MPAHALIQLGDLSIAIGQPGSLSSPSRIIPVSACRSACVDEGGPMAHMDAASGRARRARHAGMFVPAARPATHVCVSARRRRRRRRPPPSSCSAEGVAWHGAGDSVIPNAIPDTHHARGLFIFSAREATGGHRRAFLGHCC